MMRVRWLPQARRQYASALRSWIEWADYPLLLEEETAQALTVLQHTPLAGACYTPPSTEHASPRPETHRLLLPRTQYYLYYVVDQGEVIILTLWSTRRGKGPALR